MGISCKQAVDCISKKEEGKLSGNQRFQLWQHLAICKFCRSFSKQNKLLTSIFKKRPDTLPEESGTVDKQAIIKALEHAVGGSLN